VYLDDAEEFEVRAENGVERRMSHELLAQRALQIPKRDTRA
jgi:hypothetical protein